MNNRPLWDSEKKSPDLSEKIRQALRSVKDPEIGMDVIQLGLIRNVIIDEEKIKIEMILTTPYCPYAPMIMESARQKAEEATKIPVEINYGSDVWDQTMMEEGSDFNWGLF